MTPMTEDERLAVERNLRLVWYVVRRLPGWCARTVETEDMVQEVVPLLLQRIRTHDPKKGTLATWATRRIRARLLRLCGQQGFAGRIPSPGTTSFAVQDGSKSRLQVHVPAPLQLVGDVAITSPVSDSRDTAEDAAELSALLERLPESDRELLLRLYGALGRPKTTQDEEAAALGVKRKTITHRVRMMLEIMREVPQSPIADAASDALPARQWKLLPCSICGKSVECKMLARRTTCYRCRKTRIAADQRARTARIRAVRDKQTGDDLS